MRVTRLQVALLAHITSTRWHSGLIHPEREHRVRFYGGVEDIVGTGEVLPALSIERYVNLVAIAPKRGFSRVVEREQSRHAVNNDRHSLATSVSRADLRPDAKVSVPQ